MQFFTVQQKLLKSILHNSFLLLLQLAALFLSFFSLQTFYSVPLLLHNSFSVHVHYQLILLQCKFFCFHALMASNFSFFQMFLAAPCFLIASITEPIMISVILFFQMALLFNAMRCFHSLGVAAVRLLD